MTAFDDFVDFVKLAVNESDADLDILTPKAVQQAITAVERAVDFEYMKSIEYNRLRRWEYEFESETSYQQADVNAVQEMGLLYTPGTGALVLNIPLPPSTTNTVLLIPHSIQMLVESEGPLFDFIRDRIFSSSAIIITTVVQPAYKILTAVLDTTGLDLGIFDTDAAVTLPSGKKSFADYPDDDTFSVKVFPTQEFKLPDTGLLVFSGKLKRVSQIDLASDQDFREILRKDLPRFNSRSIDAAKDSWQTGITGCLPEAWDFIPQADNLDYKIRGRVAVSGQRSALLFRQIPDKEYWVRSMVKRFTKFPITDHPLIHNHEDLLLSQSIVQMAPWLRDTEQMQLHAGLVQSKIHLVKIDNAYAASSGAARKLEYDPYR